MRRRFGCPRYNGSHTVPSVSCFRKTLMAVDPDELGAALDRWRRASGWTDDVVSVDGKTIRAAKDADGRQPHILGTFGHDSLAPLSNARTLIRGDDDEIKRTNEIGVFVKTIDRIPDVAGITSPWTLCSPRGGSRPIFSDAAPTT